MSRPLHALASEERQVNVSTDELFQVICDAASQDPAKIKTSTDRLKQLLDMTGSFDALSEIAAQRNLPLHVRQQSIIQLKNAVGHHWRARRLVLPEQRDKIKARCLSLVNEPDDVISECNQVIIAKIARQDFPATWPNLVQELVTIIDVNLAARFTAGPSEFLPLRRALELLHAVTKEFSNMKMMLGLRVMAQIVEATHLKLQGYYSAIASSLTTMDPANISTPRITEDILLAHLVFKCLTKCASWSYQKVKGTTEQKQIDQWELVKSTVLQLKDLSERRIQLVLALQSTVPWDPVTTQSITYLTRHIYVFGKFFRRLLQLDAARFVSLPMSSDLVFYYWNKVVQATSSPSGYIANSLTAIFPIRFLVQGMVVFRDSLAQWSPTRRDGTVNVQALDRTFVEEAVKMLVTRFIPLNPSDLEDWMADPEEWVNVEERDNDQWEYEIRPCGERVLMTLSNQCRDFVDPLLKTTWDEVKGLDATDLSTILQKEAVYCAIGRCTSHLRDLIPFTDWLQGDLAREARGINPSYPILKRRIAWLIGKWVSSGSATCNNPATWEILVHLLQDRGPGTDAVTLDFKIDIFAPFLSPVVHELVKLVSEAETLESKRRISNALNTIIECAGVQVVPLMHAIADPIPQLWMSSGQDWLFKAVLLETVSKLIGSSKDHSAPLTALVVPMLRDCFSAGAITQLDEDGLNLWLIALRNSTTIDAVNGSPGLAELFPIAIDLIANNLDLTSKVVAVMESYFLLDAPRLLQAYGKELFTAFKTGMSQSLAVTIQGMLSALNLLLQITGTYTVWAEPIHTSGLFAHLVKDLAEEKLPSVVLTHFVHVLSRIAIADNRLFVHLMSLVPTVVNMTERQAWDEVLLQWWTRFDNMYEPAHRKLTAMGIARLAATGRPDVLDRLPTDLCNMWTDVFSEIREAVERAADEGSETLTLYWDRQPEELFADCKNTLEFDRRKTAFETDIVRTTPLTAYIVFYENYLSKIDPTVMKQMQKDLTNLGP
ncbi:hypothetical protein EUX98_g583 [Antrodiella citrinella]|uniref:Importin N-terminal domain-containing protein n=1 Tax=Antrodiella citrinella TaxID=2447956 RepID=A0A4S4N656_9APHY|nr:hypothetical protein EUX98_g583 [Antrodiella citrinella]